MFISNLLVQTAAIFILVLVGYYIRKKGILCERETTGLTNIVMLISMPATIIASMAIEMTKDKLFYAGLTVLISFILYGIKLILAEIFIRFFKISDFEAPVHRIMILLSNCGFMGIPIAGAIFGKEGLFYTAIVNICFSIISWTVGIRVISGPQEGGYRVNLNKLIKNPGIVSVVIGSIIFLTQIKIPEFIEIPLVLVTGTTTPLAMFSIGAFLTEADIKSVYKDKNLIVSTFIRLIVSPIIMIGFVNLFNFPYKVGGVLVLLEAMPIATTAAIFSRQFNSDYELASKGVFFSTIFSIVTIPVIILIFSKL